MKTRKRETSKAKRVLSLLLAVLMVIGVIQITSPFQKAKAAVGDTPAHTKNLTDNRDGTYTLSLDVVGDAEKKPNNVNVIVIFDTSGSMNDTRMSAAKNAVNSLANSLFAYNTTSEPNTVQMALVDFSTHASVVSGTPTNSYSSFSRSVQNLSAEGGTNWEAALKAANNVNFGDSDQTFVVFVSDGNPTFRDTQGTTRITDNRYYNYDNIYYSADGVYGLGSDNPNNRNYSPQSMQYCYDHAVDDAQTLATKVTPGNFFTIGAFGNVDRMEQLTDDAGSDSSTNYYNASDTAALNQAISDILAKIEMAGIANTEIDDGTTNQVTTTSGAIAELLEVDESSYKYYRSGGTYGSMQPWTDAPEAKLVNGTVEWDLSSVGVLENGVRYTVTFDVYPSQYTYDTIAQLKNGDITYDSLDSEVKKYIVDNGNGTYSLRTNTNASLSWDDTRDDEGQQSDSYINPNPVRTDAATMSVTKTWENELDARKVGSIDMTVLMDGESFHKVTLSAEDDPAWTEDPIYISPGIIKNGKVLSGAEGHDFTFEELGSEQYNWELVAPVVHPMVIDGTLTMLTLADQDHPTPAGATTYEINGKTYYSNGSSAASLDAYNYRRSNLNLTKVVTGEDAPKDATFPFTLTVNNSKASSGSADDTNSDYYVWFSIYDTKAGATVKDATVTGATAEAGDTGYYYAPSGTAITVQMKAGWNLRFTNLPTETTYTFAEGDLADGFAFNKAELTSGEDTTFSGAKTTTGTIEKTNTSYVVTYTNDYQLTDLEITKVWDDANNQDGKRLTADDLKAKLTLSPAVQGKEATVVDNGDNTYTITYTGLPRFNNGQEVEYTVTEAAIEGYETTGSPAKDHGTITNKHTPEVTKVTVVKVWDDSNDIGKIRPAAINAQLTADGTASGDPVALNADNKWTYTWENLPKYKAGKEIVYSADETTVPSGYAKTGPVKTTADGTVTFTVTNTYNPTPVVVDPPVQKIITGNDDLYNNGKFTFKIEAETEGAPMPENTSITNSDEYELEDKTGYYEFGEITFTMPGTYKYKITESGTVAGVTNDPAAAEGKTLTFTVTDDGNGNLTVNPTTDQVQLSFTNTYAANGEIELFAGKKLDAAEGLNAPDVSGKYTLTLEGQDGAPMPKEAVDGKVEIKNADGNGTMTTFGKISFTEKDAGKTYTYKVTEAGTVAGVENGTTEYTVTVTVADKGDGTLTATASPSAQTLFTNTYTVGSTSIVLSASKTLEVKGGNKAPDISGKYDLTLTGADDGVSETVKNPDGAGTKVDFSKITYTAPGTYNYTVTESGTVPGVTNGTAEYKVVVTVTDNSDGTLTAKVTEGKQVTAFTNTYNVAPTEIELKASKTLAIEPPAENAPNIDGKYTFTIEGSEDAPMPESTTATNPDGNGTAVGFGKIKYTKPGEYQYTITESGDVKGVKNGQTSYTVKVTVTDNGNGTMTASVTEGFETTAFTNTYSVTPVTLTTEQQFHVTKVLAGAPLAAGAFEFELKGDEGSPMPEKTKTTNDANGNVVFDTITYAAPGIYTYTITEVNGGKRYYTYDENKVTVTVKVEDNGDGTLGAVVSYSDDTEFNNTYTASGSVDLSVAKQLKGRTLEERQFTFELLDESGKVLQTVTNDGSGAVKFDTITYDQSIFDEKTSEQEPSEQESSEEENSEATEESSQESEQPKDESSKTEESTAEESAADEFKAEENSTEDAASNEATEESKAEESTEESEAVEESADQSYAEKLSEIVEATEKGAAEQDIVLTPSVMRIRNAETGELVDVKAAAEETTPRTKTFTYTIREVNEGKSGYTYDTHKIKVTVTVVDNGDGTLTATPSYEGETKFINTYEATGATGESAISGTKTSEKLAEGQFTFQLKDKDNNVIEEVTNDADGNFVFTALTYSIDAEDQSDLGTHTYTIVEVNDGQTGYTYDEKVAEVTVNVTDNGDGRLNCAVSYKDGAEPEFNNPYKPLATSIDLKGTKELTGFDLSAGQFTFTIAAETEGAPLPKNTEVTNDASGNISFGTITYDEVGEYVYSIKETNGGAKGYTYDETVYTVTVKVEDVNGQLKATVTGADEIKFVNTYEAEPTKIILKANKVLTGRDLKDGEFEFTVSQGENVLAKGKNDKDGNIVFDEIELRYAGTYKFTLKEVIPESKDENVTYDENAYEVTVIVKDDGSGTLIVETLADGATGVVFKNTYEKPEEPPVVPPTGDHTNMWIWVAIMIAAGLEFASLLYIKLRKKANR